MTPHEQLLHDAISELQAWAHEDRYRRVTCDIAIAAIRAAFASPVGTREGAVLCRKCRGNDVDCKTCGGSGYVVAAAPVGGEAGTHAHTLAGLANIYPHWADACRAGAAALVASPAPAPEPEYPGTTEIEPGVYVLDTMTPAPEPLVAARQTLVAMRDGLRKHARDTEHAHNSRARRRARREFEQAHAIDVLLAFPLPEEPSR